MHLIQNFFNKVYRNYLFKLWVEPGKKIQYNENHYEIMGFWSSCCNNLASGSQNGHSHSHSHSNKRKYSSPIEWLSSCLQVRVVNVVFGSWNNIWKIDRQYLIHQPHSRIDWDMQQKPLKDLFRSIWLSQFSIQPSQTVLYSIIVLVNQTISNNPVTYSDPG